MNISVQASLKALEALSRNPTILGRLTEREVATRYRGSLLGWGWTILNPLLMLAVYTFVFSTVFKARWPDLQQAGAIGFAINLFAGLIVFNLFSECIGKAPTLVLSQPSYVTKVIFPLELLSAVAVGAAAFHACTSRWCWAVRADRARIIPLTALWLPVVWLPCCSDAWGCAGCFQRWASTCGPAAAGECGLECVDVFKRDFLSGVGPTERWQPVLSLNPLVLVIEQTRAVMVSGKDRHRSISAWACPSALCCVKCASGSSRKHAAALRM